MRLSAKDCLIEELNEMKRELLTVPILFTDYTITRAGYARIRDTLSKEMNGTIVWIDGHHELYKSGAN